MEIHVPERLAMNRYGLSVDAATLPVKLARQSGQ
jgi:hypothetical protein